MTRYRRKNKTLAEENKQLREKLEALERQTQTTTSSNATNEQRITQLESMIKELIAKNKTA